MFIQTPNKKNASPICPEDNGSPNSKRKMGSPSPSPKPSPISQCDEVKLDFDIKQSTDVIDMLQHIDDLLDSTKYCVQTFKIRQNEARNKSGCKSGNVDELYRYSISSPPRMYKPDSLTQQSTIQNMIHHNVKAIQKTIENYLQHNTIRDKVMKEDYD